MQEDDYRESGTFVVELGGARYCLPRHCPHRGGRLDHGVINRERATVTCPLHHSVFCLKSGRRLGGPDCGDLALEEPGGG